MEEPKPGVTTRYEDKEMADGGEHYFRLRQMKMEEEEERVKVLRMSLLGLKSYLEEIEAKARVCYLEVVELIVEMDKEGK